MTTLQGQLLIATTQLLDPNFMRCVVLIVQHGEEGSLGLVLNRPLALSVKEACEQVLDTEDCAVAGSMHQGGPCEGPLMVVHNHDTAGQTEVVPGLYFTTEREQIEWLLKNSHVATKFFVGYAGWGAGQLETELGSGSWLLAPATPVRVFEGGEEQWTRVIREVTMGRWIDPKDLPDDPSLN